MTCGCRPRWLTDRNVATPVGPVVARACSCCGAAAGKKCAGMGAGTVAASSKHVAFKWADVCLARLEAQGALL